jgi:hypothetical protein
MLDGKTTISMSMLSMTLESNNLTTLPKNHNPPSYGRFSCPESLLSETRTAALDCPKQQNGFMFAV